MFAVVVELLDFQIFKFVFSIGNAHGMTNAVFGEEIATNRYVPKDSGTTVVFARGLLKFHFSIHDHEFIMIRPPKHFTKKTYGRGAGKPLRCYLHEEQNGFVRNSEFRINLDFYAFTCMFMF